MNARLFDSAIIPISMKQWILWRIFLNSPLNMPHPRSRNQQKNRQDEDENLRIPPARAAE